MAARIQSIDVVVGEPVLSNVPQVYLRGVSILAHPDQPGVDADLSASGGAGQVADLNGYRGAIATIYHAPSPAAASDATQFRLKHGDTATYSEHAYVSSDLDWKLIQPGSNSGAGPGAPTTLTYLIDATRVKRYVSVEVFLSNGTTLFHACVITPVGPLDARESNVDRAANLFVSGSGTLSFPNLDPS